MLQYILKRLAIIPPALLAVHFIGFCYAHIVRPLRAKGNPYLSSTIESTPLFQAYMDNIQSIFNNTLGNLTSLGTGETAPFFDVILESTFYSLGLLLLAFIISVVLGLALGIAATKTKPVRSAKWLTSLSSIGLSMPSFFLGSVFFAAWFMAIKYLGSEVKNFLPPYQGFGWDEHLIIPTLVLIFRPTVQIAQVTSSMLVEEMNKQYVKAARSIGHTWRTIRIKHAFRNILSASMLTIAGSIRLLVTELIVVEWMFNWPGIGNLLAKSLIPSQVSSVFSSGNYSLFLNPPLIAMIIVLFAVLFLFADLAASVCIRVFDPRLKTS